ncbi:ABC transporter permease [Candidatus Gracilibacteria bacterium]|nr:ABC transporter permease [Candidatus Gracilibacteria bacterium]
MITIQLLRPKANLPYVRDLLRELIARDLKLRYKRSALGIAWSLVTPLAQILIFSLLFNRVLPLNIPNYTAFVFCGVLAWSWFQNSLYAAAGSIVDNRSLVRRPGFPVAVLPAVTVGTNMIQYLLALPVLLITLLITGSALGPTALVLPLLLALQFLLTLGIAYFIAAAHVGFRDTQHLLSIGLMLLFYMTPVFYRADIVPPEYQLIYTLNPMTHMLSAYRTILIAGEWPNPLPLGIITIAASIMLLIGYTFFRSASDRFVEEV